MSAETPPADELRVLTGALAAHVERARRRGVRRMPAAPELIAAPPPATARGPQSPSSARTAPPAPVEAPRAAPVASGAPVGTAAPPAAETAKAPAPGSIPALAAACEDWEALRAAVARCEACDLCRSRTQTVFADGRGPARVMFVGEAPGFHEDEQGVPFVGRAGALLTDIIEKGMGLSRAEVVIANVLKCRPPENRDPTPAEKELCTPWLDRQIALVDPEVIIALGRHAAGHLLRSDASMAKLRSQVHRPAHLGGRRVVPTYHPAFLLRSPHMKKDCWADIQLAMRELGLPFPGRG